MTRTLSQGAQALLKNKGDHIKHGPLSSLIFHKLFFPNKFVIILLLVCLLKYIKKWFSTFVLDCTHEVNTLNESLSYFGKNSPVQATLLVPSESIR